MLRHKCVSEQMDTRVAQVQSGGVLQTQTVPPPAYNKYMGELTRLGSRMDLKHNWLCLFFSFLKI